MSNPSLDEILGFESKKLVCLVLERLQAGGKPGSFLDPCMRVWDMEVGDGRIEITCEEIGVGMVVERAGDIDDESWNAGQE